MGNSKIYTVFKGTDREFAGNRKEIAEHFRIKFRTFKDRLEKGYSLEEAIDWNGGKGPGLVKYTVFKNTDREFIGNKKEIAEHFGINYETFMDRLRRGYSLEEAIDWNGGKKLVPVKYTVFKGTNREFAGNYTEIAQHFNIKYNILNKRIKKGYSFEEAIEVNTTKVTEINLSYKGVNGNLREICKHFNKNYIEVYNKLKHNHTLEYSIENTIEPYIEC